MRFVYDFIMQKEGSRGRDLAFLLFLFGISFFQTLGRLPLMEPDEGRYAEIPREMLERGDFITPHLNYVKYFEKPPLHYWLNALSLKLFGENEFAARFAGALMALAALLFVYHLGRTLFDRRSALFAALILGTSPGFAVMARINFTDMTLTCCMTICLGSFILAARDDGEGSRGWYYVFYAFAALAVLAKGLIGIVLPGAIVFFHVLLTRRWRLLREMRLPTGILLFFLVAAPWFVLVSLRNPEFARFFFIHEHFERFLTKVHGRYQPFWFFIPVLIGCMLPWSFFLPGTAADFWRTRREKGYGDRLYLVLWAVVIFLFFSKSDSKLIPYILPVFPPLALLLGRSFSMTREDGGSSLRWQTYAMALCFVVLAAGMLLYPQVVKEPKLAGAALILPACILLGAGLLAAPLARSEKEGPLFLSCAVAFYLFGLVATTIVMERITATRNCKELALLVREKVRPGDLVASYGSYDQGLPFYGRQRVVVVGGKGELDFGSRQGENGAWFIDAPQFNDLWASRTQVYAIIRKNEFEFLQAFHLLAPPVRVLARQGDKSLITNR